MLVTMLLLSLLVSGGVAAGAAISPHGKGPLGLLVVTVFPAPVLLALAAGCGLVVARGWASAVLAGASRRVAQRTRFGDSGGMVTSTTRHCGPLL